MIVRVDVTEGDIQRGWRLDCQECPIALAVSRAVGQPAHVDHLVVVLLDSQESVNLPLDVRDRMLKYDAGEPMQPFSFELSGLDG